MMSLPLSTKNPRSQIQKKRNVFLLALVFSLIETEKAKLVVEEQKKTWWGDIAYKSYLSKQ
jgi:hypothetical protein